METVIVWTGTGNGGDERDSGGMDRTREGGSARI